MQIRIISGTVAGGGICKPGDTLDVSDSDARLLINMKKAEPYTAPKRGRPKVSPVNRMDGIDESR